MPYALAREWIAMSDTQRPRAPARIESLKVQNFRALGAVEFKNLTPLTVLLGPNGSGKSTVFDVFAFLAECFETGLRNAWMKRGGARELRTRGSEGPVTIEIQYREPGYPLITYHLSVDERNGRPIVVEEWLRWKRGKSGRPFKFLDYREGDGEAVSGEKPDASDQRVAIPLKSPDLLAVNALGQFADHPRVAALRDFIKGWHVSYLSAEQTRIQPEAGPPQRLPRKSASCGETRQATPSRNVRRTFRASRSSWKKERSWETCGWKGCSGLETHSCLGTWAMARAGDRRGEG